MYEKVFSEKEKFPTAKFNAEKKIAVKMSYGEIFASPKKISSPEFSPHAMLDAKYFPARIFSPS